MTLALHNLQSPQRKRKKRVGRGNASGTGTYAGRGLKGQRARSGGKGGLKRRGLIQSLKGKPKLGGFTSPNKKMAEVNIGQLEKAFENDQTVNSRSLISKNLIKSATHGVKVLGQGTLTKKLTVVADSFSETAKQAIEKAGGKAEATKRAQAKAPKKSAKSATKKKKK